MRTYYLYQYSGVSHRRTLNDTIIATVRALNTDDAWWLFQDRSALCKKPVGFAGHPAVPFLNRRKP